MAGPQTFGPARRVFSLALLFTAAFSTEAALADRDARKVAFASYAADGARINGMFQLPKGKGPFPAIVALHGCSGLLRKNGSMGPRSIDWANRFNRAGYAVLFPDSFGSRGHKSLCKIKKRPVKHRDRVGDLRAAADWLAKQPLIDGKRLALIGWSNGGSTVMRAVVEGASPRTTDFKTAIVFYPSCRWALKHYKTPPRLDPIIHIGAADDWTPPGPCKELAEKWHLPIQLYDGAYHAFDAPNRKLRVLKNRAYSASRDGRVHVGTHPQARAAAIQHVMQRLEQAFGSP